MYGDETESDNACLEFDGFPEELKGWLRYF